LTENMSFFRGVEVLLREVLLWEWVGIKAYPNYVSWSYYITHLLVSLYFSLRHKRKWFRSWI